MKKMTLDRIFPAINEAFRVGNRVRKRETAQDTVNSINGPYKLIDYILKLLKDYGVYVYHDGCLSNMGFYSSPAGAPELTGEENMYCVDAGPDEDPNGIFYDWFEEYVGFEPCKYVYRLIFVEIDDNTVMVGGGLNDNCDCECDTVWHWDNKDIIRKALAELAEYKKTDEAFRAGNRARKRETVQDAVSDITDVHDISADELTEALSVPDLRNKFPEILKEIIDKHSLPITVDANGPKIPGVSFSSCLLYRNDELICSFYWQSGASILYMRPVNKTISECMLYRNAGGIGKVYASSIDRLRFVLLGLDGYDITEAFKAGNRARKRETVQDAVSDITDVHDISADELEQALSVPNLRYRFPDVLTEVIDRHNLPVQLEAESSGIAGVSPYSYFLLRNGEQICKFYWESGGNHHGLYMHPENETISGCVLYLEMNGKGKLYRTSLERLRLVLLGLDGDDIEEAFKAGNRARKKESASDGIDRPNTEDLIKEALRKCEPVRRFTINTLDRMFNALPSDPLLMASSFKDGDGRNAPRACCLWDLRQGKDSIRFPCYIRPRGKQLWITVNPNNFLLEDNDYIIAKADHYGGLEFGPGVKELADILDGNYVLDDSHLNR